MKILLLGKNGQVGWELQRSLAVLGNLIALDRTPKNGLYGDLADIDGLRATLRSLRPDVVVNAAAYTQVDQAEQHPQQAERINALAPQVLAEELTKTGGWLVHYSTDYVFDGRGTVPWVETDTPRPINHYGRTKLAGEQAVQASRCKHLIFRTSWVYGTHGHNFVHTMLRLGRERERLSVVNDQVGAPTGAELLADVTAHALRAVVASPGKAGLYHVAAAGETTWYDYACFIFEQARRWEEQTWRIHKYDGPQRHPHEPIHRLDPAQRHDPIHEADGRLIVKAVDPVATSAYPTPAKRPLNSRLNTSKLQETFSLHLPHWRDGVARVLTPV